MSEDTLCKLAKRAADQGNKGYRFVDRHEKATYIRYDELFEKSMGVAGAFHKKGIKAGDRIAIVLPTCPEFFYVFFGALFVGGVPVPLYPPVRLGRMDEYHKNTARMLKVSGARLLCTDGRINKILGRSLATASPELGCVTVDEIGHEPFKYKEGNPDGPALIQFSSGTTVDPKPVLLTHRQIIANVRTILDCALNFYPEDTDEYSICGVSWLPLYHDMGLIGAAMVALMHPADLTLIPPELFIARPAIWLRTISKYRAFLSPAPNFAYSICTEKIKDNELKGVDLSCWKIALNGAEPVSPSALKKFIERFEAYGFPPHALTPVYGLSEAALAVTFSNIDQRFDSKKFNADLL
nr:AMP-binding protein [Desulfobacteraceae bacterium]